MDLSYKEARQGVLGAVRGRPRCQAGERSRSDKSSLHVFVSTRQTSPIQNILYTEIKARSPLNGPVRKHAILWRAGVAVHAPASKTGSTCAHSRSANSRAFGGCLRSGRLGKVAPEPLRHRHTHLGRRRRR